MRFLAQAPALALAAATLAWCGDPTRPEWLEITSGELGVPNQAVLLELEAGEAWVAFTDGASRQVKAIRLGDGRLQVLAGAGGTALKEPSGLAVQGKDLLIVDKGAHQVLRRTPDGRVEVALGPGASRPGRRVQLASPTGVAVGPDGVVYVTDTHNRRMLADGAGPKVKLVAGYGEGDGATAPRIGFPLGLLPLADGSVLFTASTPEAVWRWDGKSGVSPLPGLGEPEPDSLSFSQKSGGGSSLRYPGSLALGEGGAILVADPGEDELWCYRRGEGKAEGEAWQKVRLPWADSGERAHLVSVSGIAHGGVILAAVGRMWVSFPEAAAGEEGRRTQLRKLAAAMHAGNQARRPEPAGSPGSQAGVETKGAGSGPARAASSSPDAAPPAAAQVLGKRTREASQVDAAPPSEAPGGEERKAKVRRAEGGSQSQLVLQLEASPGASSSQGLARADSGEAHRQLDALAGQMAAEGRMTKAQADALVDFVKGRLFHFRFRLDDCSFLSRETGLPGDLIRRFIATVRERLQQVPWASELDADWEHQPFASPSQEREVPPSQPD